jgi:hypothetical protein
MLATPSRGGRLPGLQPRPDGAGKLLPALERQCAPSRLVIATPAKAAHGRAVAIALDGVDLVVLAVHGQRRKRDPAILALASSGASRCDKHASA